MRLDRIEAVRYGRLRDATLGGLSGGLTVVSGPNEAGKSTFTALVRHVLYGYPTQRDREAGYHVPGDGRLARLVFAENDGSWVVERSEGAHGGDARVRTLAGADRAGLLDEITRGVSRMAYQVVFGFGLDEMARIEELRGSGDDIIKRLYAASAGLTVSPHEARAAVDREAADLFKQGARKPVVNALVSELRTVRSELRDLRQQADSFRADQEHLVEMTERLARAREAREAARIRATELVLASDSAEQRLTDIHTQDEVLIDLRRARKDLADGLERIVCDDAVLAAAPELDALLDEAAGFTRDTEALRDAVAKAQAAGARAAESARKTGLEREALDALAEDHVLRATVEEARDELQRLQLVCETREEEARRAAGLKDAAERSAGGALAPLGITVSDAADSIGERLAAIDALEAQRGGAVRDGRQSPLAPAVLAVAGLLAAISGALLREWVSVGLGAVALALGGWFLLRVRMGAPAVPASGERAYLDLLGLDSGAGTLDLSRMRRTLDNARALVGALDEATRRADEAHRDLALACDARETRQALWSAWLAGNGFDPTLSPSAAVHAIALVNDARIASEAEREATSEAERFAARLDAFAARIAAAARPHLEVPDAIGRDDVAALANRIRERITAAREAAARRADLDRDLAAADSRIAVEEQRANAALTELAEILGRFGLVDGGTHDDLRALRIAAERAALEADGDFDALAEERNQLGGRLEAGAQERRGSDLALAEAGLVERLAEATDRYLVLACASRLLGSAQERYERERQPDVVKSAERLFSRMTHDRYTGLSIPLGDERIEVFGSHADAKTSDLLSRGTAEQLYLALRLGLIAQLDEVGRGLPVLMDDVLVNFDPERKRGAAEAVAELASGRQVVFFTCHPETVGVFAEVAPDHVRIDLGRCEY